MHQTLSKRDWQILGCFCILAPFIHFYVQIYWSMVAVPFFPTTKSHLLLMLSLSALELTGAALAALLLAVPAALVIRKRPLLLATVIAIATGVVTLLMWRGSFTDYAALFTTVEFAAFFLLCWLTASIIVRRLRGHRHAI